MNWLQTCVTNASVDGRWRAAPATLRRLVDPSDGLRRLPERTDLVAEEMARVSLQHHALDDDAAGRSLCRDGAAGDNGG